MGCFGDMETVGSKTQSVPTWMKQMGRQIMGHGWKDYERGFTPYGNDMVANLSDEERRATSMIRKQAGQDNPFAGETASNLRTYGNTPGFGYQFHGVTDENGPLGSIQGYMDPYLEGVLDPTMREIERQGTKQRQSNNASAMMSGAFGDARHGVVERGLREDEMQAGRDAWYKGHSDAFNSAMGLRSSDAGREFATQQAQAGEDTKMLERLRQSGIDLTNLDKYSVDRELGLADALGKAGATKRGIDQAGMDAKYKEFMRRENFDEDHLALLMSMLRGTPHNVTTTSEAPNNTGWQALGSLGGAGLSCLSSMI